jgi:hypothetical protein
MKVNSRRLVPLARKQLAQRPSAKTPAPASAKLTESGLKGKLSVK